MQILKKSIIGFVILIGLVIQVPLAQAIYSPTISKEANLIKQHILDARQQNGAGTILSAAEKVSQQETELRKQGKAVSLPAAAVSGIGKVMWQSFKEIVTAPLDPLYMIFNIIPSTNNFVSDCLRDDIWILEDLRDSVSREMIKAYLMGDAVDGGKLEKDFDYLTQNISFLKKYGNQPEKKFLATVTEDNKLVNKYTTANEYLFGTKDNANSYTFAYPLNGSAKGCPQSDFLAAFDEVRNSWETLKVLGSGGGSDWGSIWEMAKAKARVKADQWIKANQISLTIGGKEGGDLLQLNLDSLVKGGGFDKFVGKVATEWEIAKDMVGPLVPLFSWNIYSNDNGELSPGCMYYYPDDGVFRACTSDQLLDYQVCINEKSTADDKKDIPCDRYKSPTEVRTVTEIVEDYQKQATEHQALMENSEKAFVYHMQLNGVGESNITAMDIKLSAINTEIRRGFEAVDSKSGSGLPTLYNKLAQLYKKHCPNKSK